MTDLPGSPGWVEQLAGAVGGRALALAVDDAARPCWVIELDDQRVPVLVRDFGHALGICVDATQAWTLRPGTFDDAQCAEVTAAVQRWAAAHESSAPSLFDLALRVTTSLADALAQPWTASFPGTPEPRECWLHGPEFDAAAVGLFAGRVIVDLGDGKPSWSLRTREQLVAATPELLAAVREQQARYAGNVALAQRVVASGEALATELQRRLAISCTSEVWSRPSHWGTVEARVRQGQRELARVFVVDGELLVHAGVVGEAGWRGPATSLDLDAVTAAIEQAARTLTFESLEIGARYRVIAKIGELQAGMIVTFTMFDDIDNHYGVCRFRSDDGRELSVPGDYSTPRNSPLGAAYRYLERV